MTNTEFTACKLANVDHASADRRLSDLDFRLLWLMASAVDRKTGIVRRKQANLAEMLGVTRRAVQRCRDRLVKFDYLETIGKRPGGNVSAYKVVKSEKANVGSPSEEAGEKATVGSPIGDRGVAQRRPAIRTNLSPFTSPLKNLPSDNRETDDRGPRGHEGLGPLLGAKLRKRIGDVDFQAWLGKGEAELVEQTADSITIAVRSRFYAEQIRNRFEPDIAACSGVARVDVMVRQ